MIIDTMEIESNHRLTELTPRRSVYDLESESLKDMIGPVTIKKVVFGGIAAVALLAGGWFLLAVALGW